LGDVEHAHSPGFDVLAYLYRGCPRCGFHLDVLGNRTKDGEAASNIQAASQKRSRGVDGFDGHHAHAPRSVILNARRQIAIFRKIAHIF
jgi:hypothetical protein